MAKKAQVIAVTTILVIIAIAGFGLKVLGDVWDQSEKHATQAEQVKTVIEDVKALKPEVKENTEGRKQVQTDIEWIKSAVDRIEKKPKGETTEREDRVNNHIASALAELHELNENFASTPDQYFTINDAQLAINRIRATFAQETPRG